MAVLEDLERVDHPHGGADHEQADGGQQQRVLEVPVAARAGRDEAGEQRVAGHHQRPQVQVGGGAALREADAHEPVVEVVVVGAPRRAAVLEPLEHHERGVEDRHGEHEQRRDQGDRGGRLEHAVDRQRGEQEAQRERPRVAHEDLRRVVVVVQERERGAAHDRRQHRGVRRGRTRRRGSRTRRPRSPRSRRPASPSRRSGSRGWPGARSTGPSAGRRPSRGRSRRWPGSVTRSKRTSKPTTGISAISVTPASLRLGVTPLRSSKSPSAATSSVPMKIPR